MRKDFVRKKCAALLYLGLILALIAGLLSLFGQRDRSKISTLPRQDTDAAHENNGIANSNDDQSLVWSSVTHDWVLGTSGQIHGDMHSVINECVWPEDRMKRRCSTSDRIINQLKLANHSQKKFFKISVAEDYSLPAGQELFQEQQCLVNKCLITHNMDEADAIVFPNADVYNEPTKTRRIEQIWIAHFLESPPNTFDRRFTRKFRGLHTFNWTASYRSDSDIVTPYAKFVPYAADKIPGVKSFTQASEKHRALIENKQTRVAWFVSNCHAKNYRLEFARELAKFIAVDIYGKCGNLTCAKWTQAQCLELINRDYKFYLAFENSNNREYITEKLYRNALGYNDQNHLLIPIVMGPSRGDYERLAPPGSFIHVDDFQTAQELAAFLKYLADDNQSYYSYFRWKTMGKFIDTKFMCRLCAMLHESDRSEKIKRIPNIKDWWLNENEVLN